MVRSDLAGHQLEGSGHQVFARGQKQIVARNCESDFALRFRIPSQVERRLPPRCEARTSRAIATAWSPWTSSRRKICDVKKLQVADVVERHEHCAAQKPAKESPCPGEARRPRRIDHPRLSSAETAASERKLRSCRSESNPLLGRGIPVAQK